MSKSVVFQMRLAAEKSAVFKEKIALMAGALGLTKSDIELKDFPEPLSLIEAMTVEGKAYAELLGELSGRAVTRLPRNSDTPALHFVPMSQAGLTPQIELTLLMKTDDPEFKRDLHAILCGFHVVRIEHLQKA